MIENDDTIIYSCRQTNFSGVVSKIGRQCLSRNETKYTADPIKPSCRNITASTSICLKSPAEIDISPGYPINRIDNR